VGRVGWFPAEELLVEIVVHARRVRPD
jgi:hypothetical protein